MDGISEIKLKLTLLRKETESSIGGIPGQVVAPRGLSLTGAVPRWGISCSLVVLPGWRRWSLSRQVAEGYRLFPNSIIRHFAVHVADGKAFSLPPPQGPSSVELTTLAGGTI